MATQSMKDILSFLTKVQDDINYLSSQFHYENALKCIDSGINKFYASYTPTFYNRTGGLKSFAHAEIYGDNQFIFQHGPEFGSGGYRVSNDYIYMKVFLLGYHGGADADSRKGRHPATGTPYWRTPYPYYSRWGNPAPQSTSPYELIMQEWNNYCENIWPTLQKQITQILLQRYGDELINIIQKLSSPSFKIEVQITSD